MSGIQHQQHLPSENLRRHIQRITYGVDQSSQAQQLQIPPTGSMYITIVLGAPLQIKFSDHAVLIRQAFVGGQLRMEQPVVESQGQFELLGIELTPAGFYQLFKLPAHRFTDTAINLHDVAPDFAATLFGRLSAVNSNNERVAAIEDCFSELVAAALSTPVVDQAVDQIQQADGLLRVAQVAAAADLSVRQLRRRFLRVVGVPPKHFAKVVQIRAIAAALLKNDDERLAALAVEHGYFDQAHFIRDFQRYVSTNPGDFLTGNHSFLRNALGRKPQTG